jgi:CCR4-NOT transcriptional regulation complex NOT5 subunit
MLCDNSDKEKKEMIELRNITTCFRLWYLSLGYQSQYIVGQETRIPSIQGLQKHNIIYFQRVDLHKEYLTPILFPSCYVTTATKKKKK